MKHALISFLIGFGICSIPLILIILNDIFAEWLWHRSYLKQQRRNQND